MDASIFPPEATATIVLASAGYWPVSTAANAAAPPGSIINFRCLNAVAIACRASRSDITAPPDNSLLFIGKVISPGCGVTIASQMEGLLVLAFSIFPLACRKRAGTEFEVVPKAVQLRF